MVLHEEAVVALRARISAREEEDAKLVLMEAVPIEQGGSLTLAERFSYENYKKRAPGTQSAQPADAVQKLYLRVPSRDSELLERAMKVIRIFDGNMPLYVYFEDEAKYTVANRRLWVDCNKTVLAELRGILGEKNVIVK